MDQDIEYEDQEPTEAENQSDVPTEAPETNIGQVDDDIATDETQDDESILDNQPSEIEKAQAAFEKKYSKQHWKMKEEERKREAAEQKIKELENRLNTQQQQQIKIPPVPDPYDDNFEAQMIEREKAIRQAAAHDAEQKFRAEQQQQLQQQAALKAQQEAAEKTRKVYETAVKYGINQDELQIAENRVASFIPRTHSGEMLANYILEHEQSPLVIKYLGDNTMEAEKIAGMNPIKAAQYIDSTIVKRAQSLKPRISKAPEPVKSPSGRGAPKSENRFLKGVVME